jgi:hypothetical protein
MLTVRYEHHLHIKSKAISVIGGGGGVWDVEDPTFSMHSAHR